MTYLYLYLWFVLSDFLRWHSLIVNYFHCQSFFPFWLFTHNFLITGLFCLCWHFVPSGAYSNAYSMPSLPKWEEVPSFPAQSSETSAWYWRLNSFGFVIWTIHAIGLIYCCSCRYFENWYIDKLWKIVTYRLCDFLCWRSCTGWSPDATKGIMFPVLLLTPPDFELFWMFLLLYCKSICCIA